jgi:hypothetical protein
VDRNACQADTGLAIWMDDESAGNKV